MGPALAALGGSGMLANLGFGALGQVGKLLQKNKKAPPPKRRRVGRLRPANEKQYRRGPPGQGRRRQRWEGMFSPEHSDTSSSQYNFLVKFQDVKDVDPVYDDIYDYENRMHWYILIIFILHGFLHFHGLYRVCLLLWFPANNRPKMSLSRKLHIVQIVLVSILALLALPGLVIINNTLVKNLLALILVVDLVYIASLVYMNDSIEKEETDTPE